MGLIIKADFNTISDLFRVNEIIITIEDHAVLRNASDRPPKDLRSK